MAYQRDPNTIPSPLPTDYDRQHNFTDWTAGNPTTPIPGNQLDAEFSAIERAIDETQSRLRLIQRDDGALQNGSVSIDTLADSTLADIIAAANSAANDVLDEAITARNSAQSARDTAQTAAATATARAGVAANGAAAASTSADEALSHYQAFLSAYYGALSADPTEDPNGDAPTSGDFYFNDQTLETRIYDGNGWVAAVATSAVSYATDTASGLIEIADATEGDSRTSNNRAMTSLRTNNLITSRIGTAAAELVITSQLDVRLATAGNLGNAAQRAVGTAAANLVETSRLDTRLGTAGNLGNAATKTVGSGNGLDADTVDGVHASQLLTKTEFNPGVPTPVWSGGLTSVPVSALSQTGPGFYVVAFDQAAIGFYAVRTTGNPPDGTHTGLIGGGHYFTGFFHYSVSITGGATPTFRVYRYDAVTAEAGDPQTIDTIYKA